MILIDVRYASRLSPSQTSPPQMGNTFFLKPSRSQLSYWPSTLQWPRQQIPNRSAWNKWSLFLQHFHHNDILSQPLGPWLSPTHQHWTWFTNPISDSIYHYSIEDNQWSIHLPLTPPFHQYPGTRQARLWYSTSHSEPCQPPTATQPTSITFHTNASFHTFFTSAPGPPFSPGLLYGY